MQECRTKVHCTLAMQGNGLQGSRPVDTKLHMCFCRAVLYLAAMLHVEHIQCAMRQSLDITCKCNELNLELQP